MWNWSDNSPDIPGLDEYEQYLIEQIGIARKYKDRESYEDLIDAFACCVSRKTTVSDALMNFVSDTLAELVAGKNVVKVSDVLGSRPPGSRGINAPVKREQHRKITEVYVQKWLHGSNRAKAIEETAEECGVTTRTVENVVAEWAKHNPGFRSPKKTS